ncbi:branched-chain amino acid transport system substrate-binding protein [Roseivivax halotolerans]|uniref:Branched-chain amino acid transport system substrate-binding protein n=1 Tax=Roseivivax halotolerans TaxID=93684 RepID=A0A1I6AL08_9RHOB|nr:transporter substrate-binding protein [Roseivivax halotolerans]SFQ69375.1 branched-chain amino acid transport system substrate-binding protein [Roseivivax halotolerans]
MLSLDIGLVFSTTGPYAALGRAARAGAQMAIADLECEGRARITPMHRDPGGCPRNYEIMTADILRAGVSHVVGAITSWSRKDMIPVLERHGGLLWYPCPYEGFESNDHVVYMGAAPNHHMIPLLDRILREGIGRAYLLGSNYVWGWETLRLARERLVAAGVEIVGERFLPLGDTDCGRAIDEIAAVQPDIVMNSLIGPSNVAFFSGLPSENRPKVLSCNQTEADLDVLGDAGEGLISAGTFFEALGPDTFVRRAARAAPNGRCSAFFATTYASVRLMAESVRRAGATAPRAVFEAACAAPHDTVLGPVTIDQITRHAALTPHIAKLRAGRFEIVASAPAPVPADPYLINLPLVALPAAAPSALRIVQ